MYTVLRSVHKHTSGKKTPLAMLAEEEYMQVRVGIFSSARCVSSPAE